MSKISLALLVILAALPDAIATAGTLQLSVSGQLSGSDVSVSPLVVPDGLFALSFNFDSNTVPSNVSSGGFDLQFSNFSYKLNNIALNIVPDFIRLLSAASGGLLTVFFGPESGFLNGIPIP